MPEDSGHMETLRCTCELISPVWFASLRSEEVIGDGCRGKSCVPSLTSMHCMVSKFEK